MTLMERKFGVSVAQKLARRLHELSAAEILSDLNKIPHLHCHELKGARKGQFAINIDQRYRIVFDPANKPVPRKPDGGIDWTEVNSIRIIAVEDYHD